MTRDAQRHQEGKHVVKAPDAEEDRGEENDRDEFLRERKVVAPRLFHIQRPCAKRRSAETEVQRIVRAGLDAIKAFHAAGVDDHLVQLHLLGDADVGGAGGGTVPAFSTGVGDTNPRRGEPIGQGEETAVRAGVGAEPLRPEEIDNGNAAAQKRDDREQDAGEGVPETRAREVPGERRGPAARESMPDSPSQRPEKHINRGGKRDENHEPGAKGLGPESQTLENPQREILIGDEMAAPAADPTTENQRREQGGSEEEEAHVDLAGAEGLHRLGGFDGRERLARPNPVQIMTDHEEMDADEGPGPPETGTGTLAAGSRIDVDDGEGMIGCVLSDRFRP